MNAVVRRDDEGDTDHWIFEVYGGLIVDVWRFHRSGVEAAYEEDAGRE